MGREHRCFPVRNKIETDEVQGGLDEIKSVSWLLSVGVRGLTGRFGSRWKMMNNHN